MEGTAESPADATVTNWKLEDIYLRLLAVRVEQSICLHAVERTRTTLPHFKFGVIPLNLASRKISREEREWKDREMLKRKRKVGDDDSNHYSFFVRTKSEMDGGAESSFLRPSRREEEGRVRAIQIFYPSLEPVRKRGGRREGGRDRLVTGGASFPLIKKCVMTNEEGERQREKPENAS